MIKTLNNAASGPSTSRCPALRSLTSPDLCEVVFDDLANQVDAILHSGGLVDWMLPSEDYVRPHILDSHVTLCLASCDRGKVVHFISTISTLPIHVGYGLAKKLVVAARFRDMRWNW